MLGPRPRVLTPHGDEHRFTEACFALSTATRVAIVATLVNAGEPLHIREIARRVDMDPSPVRAHLELLVKTGFARELHEPGRERRFVAEVSGVRLVLSPPDRPADAPPGDPPKAVRKLTEKMADLEAKIHKLELELARLGDERADAWLAAARE